MIQKQAEHSLYVYTFKTSSAGEVLKVCGFSPNPQYEANTRCWLSNEETAGRLTLTELLQESDSSIFLWKPDAVLP